MCIEVLADLAEVRGICVAVERDEARERGRSKVVFIVYTSYSTVSGFAHSIIVVVAVLRQSESNQQSRSNHVSSLHSSPTPSLSFPVLPSLPFLSLLVVQEREGHRVAVLLAQPTNCEDPS